MKPPQKYSMLRRKDQRKPWQVISVDWKWIILKQTDAGEKNFGKKIHEGLPERKRENWRFQFQSKFDKVYALIGKWLRKGSRWSICLRWCRWKLRACESRDNRLTQRAWYLTFEVFAESEWREHSLGSKCLPMLQSMMAERLLSQNSGAHGDYHDIWFNPTNSKNMILARWPVRGKLSHF